jgi:REP element-mobilizing transposase RayT
LAINGTANHIHILFLLSPKIALCNLVQRVKGASSHAINRSDLFKHKFSWSIGYGAFSVSESAISRVERYIQNQKYHHRKKTFTEEYEHFLVHHNLDLPS